jgi:hypothetical protein
MTWDALLGQDAALAGLRAALRARRPAHAYLFEGPPGVGKRTAAFLLAQVLLCHHPPAADLACGACHSCRWLAARAGLLSDHPDLLVPMKYPDDRDRARVLGDQELVIPLETMQYLAAQLHRAPSHGPRRVALIPEAQRMCGGQAEAANSFLKTLEEPPPRSAIVLTSSRPEALLETILSRVQPVRLRRLPADAIREGLRRAGLDRSAADLELALAMSDGSLGRARELIEGDLGAWRRKLLEELARLDQHACPRFGLALWQLAAEEGTRLYAAAQGEQPAAQAGESQDEAGAPGEQEEARKTEAGWQRHVFLRLLELGEAAFRDGLMKSSGAGEDGLLLKGQDAGLAEKLARDFAADGCRRALEALHEARQAVRLYVRGDLVARVLAGRLVEARRA